MRNRAPLGVRNLSYLYSAFIRNNGFRMSRHNILMVRFHQFYLTDHNSIVYKISAFLLFIDLNHWEGIYDH